MFYPVPQNLGWSHKMPKQITRKEPIATVLSVCWTESTILSKWHDDCRDMSSSWATFRPKPQAFQFVSTTPGLSGCRSLCCSRDTEHQTKNSSTFRETQPTDMLQPLGVGGRIKPHNLMLYTIGPAYSNSGPRAAGGPEVTPERPITWSRQKKTNK